MSFIDTPDRSDPPSTTDERTMLIDFLDFYRSTLLAKCAGLDADELCTRSVPPSTMSLAGMLRHMAEVERYWFEQVWLGADVPSIYCGPNGDTDDDWDEAVPATVTADIETYVIEVGRARGILAEVTNLSTTVTRLRRGANHELSMRWIVIHMIEEYARHCGHADLLRQCIDGTTGE